MANRDKSHITVDHRTVGSREENGFTVVVNDEGQRAMWRAELALPAGWRRQSAAMPEHACRAAIAAGWHDITPDSIRAAGPVNGHREAPADRGRSTGENPHRNQPQYVHDLFGERAARWPDSDAVISATGRLTYRQLDKSANQLARRLQGMGVGPETLVGVCLERGTQVIRCLLAILKSGGAYLPLDPSLPVARLTQMCGEARPLVILTGRAHAGTFSGAGATLLFPDELALPPADQPVTAPDVSLRGENIVYAIYTSGSTGPPKAVAVSHASLACVSRQLCRRYQISPRDRVLQLASLGFDTSVEQILVTLLCGATLMLPAAGPVAPTDLLRYIAQERVTVMDLTPAYWHQMLAITEPDDRRLGTVRLMITGGDMASSADCAAAMRTARGARLVNAYGLTETTITSTLADVGEDVVTGTPTGPVPVGRPLPHTQVLVLDGELAQVPAGEAGEIYLGGCGVGRGYLGRPELTAERFVPNPHAAVPGSRMYRTGDVGRWRTDQQLEITGRSDRQIKIRGFRVEPAEIESALTGHPGVDEAVVIAHKSDLGYQQLVAYYTRRAAPPSGSNGDQAPNLPCAANLRAFLSARVPDFMVPGFFVEVDQMPLTPGGKVDRRALPSPVIAADAGSGEEYTRLQAGMSHLWSRVLETGQVGLDDDFFLLGGDSLRAAEMLARARVMFGIRPDRIRPLTRRLLRDPTLRGFSQATQDARAGSLTADGSDHQADFGRDAAVDHPVERHAGAPPDWRRPREVLLTGATGFLGVHLLCELLTSTTARVHCLVRAPSAAHALRRIARAAQRYGLGRLDLGRVVPLAGDLAQPGLSLPSGTFSELAKTIDVIYHAGAAVNFIYPYEELRAANVTGTRELIRLAGLYRGIPVHYVSTTAVLAGFGAMGIREVTEDTPLAYADHLCMGYLETKFVAEELLRNAGRAGLPVAIYRPLDIMGDQHAGVWNTATEMCALVRFITDTGLAPDIDLPLDFVPADVCAAAIRHISSHAAASGYAYHLASPQSALLESLVDRLRHRGFAVRDIPYRAWVDELLRYAADHPRHPMTAFVPLFVDRCRDSGLAVAEMYLEHVFPAYTRSRTDQALHGSGIAFPAVGEELLDLSIDRLITTGYLRDPGRTADSSRTRASNAGQALPCR